MADIKLQTKAQHAELSEAMQEHLQSLKVRRDALVAEKGECEVIVHLTERIDVSRLAWDLVRRAF